MVNHWVGQRKRPKAVGWLPPTAGNSGQLCRPTLRATKVTMFDWIEQLRLLLDQLRWLEAKVAESATESLLRQHRFLAGKSRSA